MAFESLSEKLQNALGKLTGKGKLSEKDVDIAMREVRLALLEADVNFKVVKDFIKTVKARSIGSEVMESLKDVTTYETYPEAFIDLEIGRSKAVVVDEVYGKYFISNQENKGFSLEQNSNINKLENINSTYKSYQQKIGKITEIFGFENDYFKNLIEVLSNDELSKGLGDYTNKFLRKSKNIRKFENIDIDKIFTIAYEANGNRIVINNENEIYIYAHDLIESRYEIINDIPKNTFYKIPKISTLEEFIKAFFEDFLNK